MRQAVFHPLRLYFCILIGFNAPFLSLAADSSKAAAASAAFARSYEEYYEKLRALGRNPLPENKERVRKEALAPYYAAQDKSNQEVVRKYYKETAPKIRQEVSSRSEAVKAVKKELAKKSPASFEKARQKNVAAAGSDGPQGPAAPKRAPSSFSAVRVGGDSGTSGIQSGGAESVDFNAAPTQSPLLTE